MNSEDISEEVAMCFSVDSFLSEFSREVVWDEYCLAYIFNNRDFDGGILGLAWTGDLDSDGGVCEDSAVSDRLSILFDDVTEKCNILVATL